MALDATVGGVSANSYVTVEEADAYFLDRSHSELWTDILPGKDAILVTASRTLDWFFKYKGTKATDAQSMYWPRIDAVRNDGTTIDSTVIPPELKVAVFELALSSIEEDPSLDNELAGLSAVQAGPLSIRTAGGIYPRQKQNIPDRVRAIVRDLTTNSGARVIWLNRA